MNPLIHGLLSLIRGYYAKIKTIPKNWVFHRQNGNLSVMQSVIKTQLAA